LTYNVILLLDRITRI